MARHGRRFLYDPIILSQPGIYVAPPGPPVGKLVLIPTRDLLPLNRVGLLSQKVKYVPEPVQHPIGRLGLLRQTRNTLPLNKVYTLNRSVKYLPVVQPPVGKFLLKLIQNPYAPGYRFRAAIIRPPIIGALVPIITQPLVGTVSIEPRLSATITIEPRLSAEVSIMGF